MKYDSLNSGSDGNKRDSVNSSIGSNSFMQTEVYSGNPVINRYVTATRQMNQSISRQALATMPEEFIRPIFASLSNDNKLRIIYEKVLTLVNSGKFTSEEQKHLMSIFSFIKPNSYDGNFSASTEKRLLDSWVIEAQERFGWTREQIRDYVTTIHTLDELSNIKNNNINYQLANNLLDCACSSSNDWCISASCSGGPCKASGSGCGLFFLFPCDALCLYTNITVNTFSKLNLYK